MEKGLRQYLRWTFLLIFFIYYGSVAFFMHMHIEDGVAVVHSHPFWQTDDSDSHEHSSSKETYLFYALSLIHVTGDGFSPFSITSFEQQLDIFISSPSISLYYSTPEGQKLLRAPPVC